MFTGPLHPRRIALLTLALSLLSGGITLADGPMSVVRRPGGDCAPAMSPAALQVAPDPLSVVRPCYWAIYDEFWKDNEVCRYGDTCSGQYFGTCPDGYDYHSYEIFPCCR